MTAQKRIKEKKNRKVLKFKRKLAKNISEIIICTLVYILNTFRRGWLTGFSRREEKERKKQTGPTHTARETQNSVQQNLNLNRVLRKAKNKQTSDKKSARDYLVIYHYSLPLLALRWTCDFCVALACSYCHFGRYIHFQKYLFVWISNVFWSLSLTLLPTFSFPPNGNSDSNSNSYANGNDYQRFSVVER